MEDRQPGAENPALLRRFMAEVEGPLQTAVDQGLLARIAQLTREVAAAARALEPKRSARVGHRTLMPVNRSFAEAIAAATAYVRLTHEVEAVYREVQARSPLAQFTRSERQTLISHLRRSLEEVAMRVAGVKPGGAPVSDGPRSAALRAIDVRIKVQRGLRPDGFQRLLRDVRGRSGSPSPDEPPSLMGLPRLIDELHRQGAEILPSPLAEDLGKLARLQERHGRFALALHRLRVELQVLQRRTAARLHFTEAKVEGLVRSDQRLRGRLLRLRRTVVMPSAR